MTPKEWIQDVRESIERDDEPRLLLENLKVGADHLAAALEEIAYIRPILEASEAECRRREEQDLVWRTKYTLLENEIARLRAEAGRVVVPELTQADLDREIGEDLWKYATPGSRITNEAAGMRDRRKLEFSAGYRFAASRAHSVPSSRVLKDGEVAVDAGELAALRKLFSAAGNTIANIRSGVTIAEINDAWAGVCSAQIMRTQAESGKAREVEG